MNSPHSKSFYRLGFIFLTTVLGVSVLQAPQVRSQPFSHCLQDTAAPNQQDGPRIRSIYISEAEGRILEICLDIPGATLSVSEVGALSLLQREAEIDISYYSHSVAEGLLREIGSTDIDYFSSGSRSGKLRAVDHLRFDYFIQGFHAGRINEILDFRIDYFDQGQRFGKLKRIGAVSIDYGDNGEIETDGRLDNLRLIIVHDSP